MKKLILALSILTIALAGPTFAQNAWMNNIGIYNDAGEFNVNAAAGDIIPVHVILDHATGNNIKGFELNLIEEGGMILSEAIIDVDHVDAATRQGEYMVGFGEPHPFVGGAFELMHFNIWVTDETAPAHLYIEHLYFSTLEGAPSYINSDSEVIGMNQSTGAQDSPVFLINSLLTPVATESTTFDGLKSLYR